MEPVAGTRQILEVAECESLSYAFWNLTALDAGRPGETYSKAIIPWPLLT